MKKLKEFKGITLVALVVTIIILLILAGVTILQLSENGLLKNAEIAKEKTEDSIFKENVILDGYYGTIEEYLNGGRKLAESAYINDFEPLVKYNNGNNLYITSDASTSNGSSIAGYAYLCNGKVKDYSKSSIGMISDLELGAEYTITVIAMDEDGKIKTSKDLKVTTTNDKKYLYDRGLEFTEITGGWYVKYIGGTSAGYGSASKESNYIALNTISTWASYGALTTNQIDFTDMNKLYIDIADISTGSYAKADVTITAGSTGKSIVQAELSAGQYYLDVSTLTGNNIVQISVSNGVSAKLNSVWLEK